LNDKYDHQTYIVNFEIVNGKEHQKILANDKIDEVANSNTKKIEGEQKIVKKQYLFVQILENENG
jgi:hypothetical protein